MRVQRVILIKELPDTLQLWCGECSIRVCWYSGSIGSNRSKLLDFITNTREQFLACCGHLTKMCVCLCVNNIHANVQMCRASNVIKRHVIVHITPVL